METKLCPACSTEKIKDLFYKSKSNLDGLCYKCKLCCVNKVSVKNKDVCEDKKVCSACEENKTLSLYYKDKRNPDGLFGKCKKCTDNKIPKKKKIFIVDGHKQCSKCKNYKKIDDFKKCTNNSFGLYSYCKECSYANVDREIVKEYKKKWYQKNKKEISEKSKIKYIENKETISTRSANYNKTEHAKKLRKEARLKRIALNPVEKVSTGCRGLIALSLAKSLKNKVSHTKSKRTEEILGCTMGEFLDYLESQFLNWMSWDNYGRCEDNSYNCSWHLDHIVPNSYAKTEEEVYLLNHWSNFQPLCSKKNNEKLDKVFSLSNMVLNMTFMAQ